VLKFIVRVGTAAPWLFLRDPPQPQRDHYGKTVCEAFIASYYLEKACQFQILAQSAGVPLAMPADEIIAASGGRPAADERAWPSLLRMLDREDPSCRD
jgi:hypothetical protein